MRATKLMAGLLAFYPLAAAEAGGTFDQLPEDGAWTKHYVIVAAEDVDLRLELTISSVGRSQHSGKDCRWVELLSKDADTGARINVVKLLLPEAELKQGPFGPSDAVKSWVAEEDDRLPDPGNDDSREFVAFLFPDTLDDARRPDESEAIEWQRGKLECSVLTGTSRTHLGGQLVEIEHRYLLNNEVPFGLGGFRHRLRFTDSGNELTVDARRLEFGNDARSALPHSQ